MTYLINALPTPRPRPAAASWERGDTVLVSGVRWIIRHISTAGDVVLVAANVVGSAATWHTTLDNLPVKES